MSTVNVSVADNDNAILNGPASVVAEEAFEVCTAGLRHPSVEEAGVRDKLLYRQVKALLAFDPPQKNAARTLVSTMPSSILQHRPMQELVKELEQVHDDCGSSLDPENPLSFWRGLGYRRRLCGSINVQTCIKECSFVGDGCFVAAGSDCGHCFLWGEDGQLARVFTADSEIVNCVQANPIDRCDGIPY